MLAFEVPDNVWGSVMALLGAITLWFAADARRHSKEARKQASETNSAVNQNAGGAPRIYDMLLRVHTDVRELRDWMQTYQGGPLDSGHKVDKFVADVRTQVAELRADVHEMMAKGCAKLCEYNGGGEST